MSPVYRFLSGSEVKVQARTHPSNRPSKPVAKVRRAAMVLERCVGPGRLSRGYYLTSFLEDLRGGTYFLADPVHVQVHERLDQIHLVRGVCVSGDVRCSSRSAISANFSELSLALSSRRRVARAASAARFGSALNQASWCEMRFPDIMLYIFCCCCCSAAVDFV